MSLVFEKSESGAYKKGITHLNEMATLNFIISEKLEERLCAYMKGRVYPSEIATTFNFILYDEFSKSSLEPVFVGQYFVDPANPEQTRVYCHQGTEACSPIPVKRGVIGRAVRTGKDQYVPDVKKSYLYMTYSLHDGMMVREPVDESYSKEESLHVGCDPNMKGSELVLVAWSEPYKDGKYKGCSVPLGVLDLDVNVTDAFSEDDIARLRSIWDKYGKMIFGGEPKFQPKGELFVKRLYEK